MLSCTLIIRNPRGIHARAAARFVQAAAAHSGAIRLRKGDKAASGKSVLGLLTLGMKCGDLVAIEIDSDDSDELARLEAILADAAETQTPRNDLASGVGPEVSVSLRKELSNPGEHEP